MTYFIGLRVANAIRLWRIALQLPARFTQQSYFRDANVNNGTFGRCSQGQTPACR